MPPPGKLGPPDIPPAAAPAAAATKFGIAGSFIPPPGRFGAVGTAVEPKEPTGGGAFGDTVGAAAICGVSTGAGGGASIWPGIGTGFLGAAGTDASGVGSFTTAGAAGCGTPGSGGTAIFASAEAGAGSFTAASHKMTPSCATTSTEREPQARAAARSRSFVRIEEGGVTDLFIEKGGHRTVPPGKCQLQHPPATDCKNFSPPSINLSLPGRTSSLPKTASPRVWRPSCPGTLWCCGTTARRVPPERKHTCGSPTQRSQPVKTHQ